jgi:sterol desaturase/sphingolipid hydroxylase (fatty acid hydroxylase superfamily)
MYVPLGPLKFAFNNHQTHLWHHAQELPEARRNGVNFALTLTVFGKAYVPTEQAHLPVGFAGVEHYPRTFGAQQV